MIETMLIETIIVWTGRIFIGTFVLFGTFYLWYKMFSWVWNAHSNLLLFRHFALKVKREEFNAWLESKKKDEGFRKY